MSARIWNHNAGIRFARITMSYTYRSGHGSTSMPVSPSPVSACSNSDVYPSLGVMGSTGYTPSGNSNEPIDRREIESSAVQRTIA